MNILCFIVNINFIYTTLFFVGNKYYYKKMLIEVIIDKNDDHNFLDKEWMICP